jgi:transposase
MDQGVSLFDVVVVCDNASIHAGVKEVVALSDYVGVELIKLSPYSPMLNPI